MVPSAIEIPGYHSPVIWEKNKLMISDHLAGFDSTFYSHILGEVIKIARVNNISNVSTGYFLDEKISTRYPDIKFFYKEKLVGGNGWEAMKAYNVHPEQTFKKFLCSFNGSPHVGRKLLVAILQKLGFFNPKTCSKNFSYSVDALDGHLADFLEQQQCRIYKKYFIGDDSQTFFANIYSFGHVRYDHKNNIYNLEDKITQSFLHVVSETLATSYYPIVSEKFLYSVVTRGLFVAYAQPGWHEHLERYYGFRKYDKIFDYGFDEIQNPVERLVDLMSMISKFSVLSRDDWRDLYEMEIDTIEYNHDHYFSKKYIKQFEQVS